MAGSWKANQGIGARRISRIQDMSMALAAFVILLSIFLMFTAAQAKGRYGGSGGGRAGDGSEGNLTSLGSTTLGGSNHGVQARGGGGIGGRNSDSGGNRGGGDTSSGTIFGGNSGGNGGSGNRGGGDTATGGGGTHGGGSKLSSLKREPIPIANFSGFVRSTFQAQSAAVQLSEVLFCHLQSVGLP